MGTPTLILRLATKRAPYRRGGFLFESTRVPIDVVDLSTLTELNARRLHEDQAITISVVQPGAGDTKDAVIAVLPQRGTLEQLVAAKPAIGPAFPWIAANAKAAADAAQAEADAKAQAEQAAADAAEAEAKAKADALKEAATAAVQAVVAAQPALVAPPAPPAPAAQSGQGSGDQGSAGGKGGKATGGAA